MRQHIEREHRSNALFAMAKGYIFVKGNAQLRSNAFTYSRRKVLDFVATLGRGDDTPIAIGEGVAQHFLD